MGKLSKDKRDVYYRKAKEEGYRARSAYKLLQIDDKLDLLQGCTRIVDLCAAPGSWSQVIATRLGFDISEQSKEYYTPPEGEQRRIVAVDLQEMAPINGVICIKGDITCQETASEVLSHFDNSEKADLVVCDGAPDVTGMHDLDEFIQGQIVIAALAISTCLLRPKGTFVAKVFRGENIGMLYNRLGAFFSNVKVAKPKSSRNSSPEAFVVCRDFKLPDGYGIPSLRVFANFLRRKAPYQAGSTVKNIVVPFVSCGDLDAYDADRNYLLDDDHEYLEPVQKPIHAPYEQALGSRVRQADEDYMRN